MNYLERNGNDACYYLRKRYSLREKNKNKFLHLQKFDSEFLNLMAIHAREISDIRLTNLHVKSEVEFASLLSCVLEHSKVQNSDNKKFQERLSFILYFVCHKIES